MIDEMINYTAVADKVLITSLIDADNIQCLKQILAELNLDELIIYHNTAGKAFQNSIGQIIYHVCNHATYHRAQVAAILKAHHIVSPLTDFIILKRNHFV